MDFKAASSLGEVMTRFRGPAARRRLVIWLARRGVLVGIVVGLAACTGRGSPAPEMAAREIPAEKLCTREVYEEPPEWIDLADHLLPADELGRYVQVSLDEHQVTAHDFESQVANILEAHARFRRQAAVAGKPDRVLIYVHGGRTNFEKIIGLLRQQVPCMAKAGYFAIYLAWDTGFRETYWEQVSRVRNGNRHQSTRWTMPLYVAGDVAKGLAHSPALLAAEIRRYLGSAANSALATTGIRKFDPAAEAPMLEVRYDGPGHNGHDLAWDTLRFVGAWPGKLVATPLAGGLGERIWQSMLRRTKIQVATAGSAHGTRHRGDRLKDGYGTDSSAFSRFFEILRLCVEGHPGCPEPAGGTSLADLEITFVGHSMGAIILDDLVDLHDRLPYRDLVHMGSAENLGHFLETVVPVMDAKPDLRFYNLSLHPVAEASESNAWGAMPVGSLLEWADHMYTRSNSPLDKSLGRWASVAAAADLFPERLRDAMQFRVFGFRPANQELGDPGDPRRHNQFDDTEMHYWLPDYWGKSVDGAH